MYNHLYILTYKQTYSFIYIPTTTYIFLRTLYLFFTKCIFITYLNILLYNKVLMLQHANILLVFSSLCFLCPSILSFYKAHYIHSFLCFQSSIISTMYWSNTENKQMLVYDKVAATLGCTYWLMFSSIQQHKYAKQISVFCVISAISYIVSNQLSTIKLRPTYWVLVHFLFHMSTITSGCIYFLFLD